MPASATCWPYAEIRQAIRWVTGSRIRKDSPTRRELVSLLRAHGAFSVGVAAFPYKHPRSPDVDTDTTHFVAKCRAGADYAITQMFFEADAYLRLRDRVVAAGGETPIIAGLMPVTSMTTIERSEQFTGAPFPPDLGERFAAVAHDPKAIRALGVEQLSGLARTAPRRRRAGDPLLYAQPVDGHPRGLAQPAAVRPTVTDGLAIGRLARSRCAAAEKRPIRPDR